MGSQRHQVRGPQAALLIVVALATASCATTATEIPPGQPPEYNAGYQAGCDSGYVAAGHPYYQFSKDATRYATDALYKQGWDDGMTVCKGKYEHVRELAR